MALTGQHFLISTADYRASIAEVGGNLAGFWRGDRPVTVAVPGDRLPPMSCGAVLIPWPNRIRDGRYSFDGADHQLALSEPARGNASHGLIRWERLDLQERTPSSVTLGLELVPQPGYEFQLSLQLRYSLDAGGLTVTTSVINTGAAPAPFGAGFHPYFDLGGAEYDDVDVSVPASSVLITDEQQIPVRREAVDGTVYDLRQLRALGSLRLDHGFADLTGDRVVVGLGDARAALWWSEQFGYLQVFTAPAQRFGRTALAVEPMTCPADAFNSGDGLISLAPGERWTGSWGIEYPAG